MKNFLLSLSMCLFAMTTAIGQYYNVDFETGGTGAAWTWVMDQNGDNPPLEFIANPVSGGSNVSPAVAKFTARLAGQPFALTFTDDIDEFQFDATNSSISIMVYKSVISDVALKFEGASAPVEIKMANTTTDAWELMTFDFSGSIGNTYNRLVVIPDFVARTQENIIYFDNIQLPTGNVVPPAEPMTAAPTPTENEMMDNVLSVYSGVYTDLAGTDFNPNWGQTTVQSFETIAGDETNKYGNLTYQGTQLAAAQDVSMHEFVHLDFWTPNATFLEFFLISQTTGERKFDLTVATEQWVSVDIPISHFTDLGLGVTDIHQFKVVGNGNVWFDNWYFHGDAVPPAPIEPMVAAPTPTENEVTDNVVSIYSAAYTDLANTNFNPDWGQATAQSFQVIAGDETNKYSGLNYQGTQLENAQDVSARGYFHVDFWTANNTFLEFFLISQTTGERKYDLPVAPEQWISVDIPLNYFVDLGLGLTDIHQFKVVGDGNVWFDNWYFYGDYFPSTAPTPMAPPPSPTVDQVDNGVIGVFTDDYTNIAGINYNPNWGQGTTVSFEDLSGNFLMKYAGLDYQGTDFAGNPQDVSELEFLHVDFWTNNSTDLGIFLISGDGAEHEFLFNIVADQWNSVDIPLIHFATGAFAGAAPVDLTDIIQLKVDGNGSIWFDNIYFYKNSPLPAELISFAATTADRQVNLNWTTASEENTDYFEVQHSLDGRSFETIGRVEAAGESTTTQFYQLTDETPNFGINYYRLKQVDFNRKVTNSEVVTARLEQGTGFELIKKYVAANEIVLDYQVKAAGNYTLSAFDVSGQILYNRDVQLSNGINQLKIDTAVNGIIIVRLTNNSEQVIDKVFK